MADLRDEVVRFWSRLHEAGFRASNGRALNQVFGMPVLQLTTRGRRTGAPRTTMLTAPLHENGKFVLVASNGGDHRHPDWYLNIVTCPDVEVMTAGRTQPMTARIADAEERARLWPSVARVYQGYLRYQNSTGRSFPLVILEPKAP